MFSSLLRPLTTAKCRSTKRAYCLISLRQSTGKRLLAAVFCAIPKVGKPGLGGFVTPIFPATVAWERADCDAFWGPSVHWNSYLQQYVMLLNRANGTGWVQASPVSSVPVPLTRAASWADAVVSRGRSPSPRAITTCRCW